MIRVLYLGKLADHAGRPESEFVSTSDEIGWPDLLALLENHVCEGLAELASDPGVKLAVNGTLIADKTALDAHDGDEIALLPPVSGG